MRLAKASKFLMGSVVAPAIAAAVVASVIGGVFVANATPSSITVCASKASGAMRYVTSAKCKGQETKLVIGQQGATGATGATGAAGSYATAMSVSSIPSAGYTLVLADAGKLLYSLVSPTITIPTNASVAFPIGTRIDIGQLGATTANIIFITPATGVTLNGGSASAQFDRGAYQMGSLIKIATNEWLFLKPVDENS